MKNKENEVYVIGGKKHISKLWVILISVGIALCIGAAGWIKYEHKQKLAQGTRELNAIEILPETATPPKFDGKYDFSEFMKWIASNIKYPKGYETVNARVVISFVITSKGDLKDINVVAEPEQQEFADVVIALLKTCPKWAPGTLANGTPTDISYTLPIHFNNTKHFN